MRTVLLLFVAVALTACGGHRKSAERQTLDATAVSADTLTLRRSVEAVIERLSATTARIDSLTVTLRAPDGSTATIATPRVSIERRDTTVAAVSDSTATSGSAVRMYEAAAETRSQQDVAIGAPGVSLWWLMALLIVPAIWLYRRH